MLRNSKKFTPFSVAFMALFVVLSLSASGVRAAVNTSGLSAPVSLKNPSQFESLADFVGAIPYILTAFIGVGTLFGFLLGAYMYFTSGGNEEQMEKGKTQMVGSVVALFIVLSAGGLIALISNFLTNGTP